MARLLWAAAAAALFSLAYAGDVASEVATGDEVVAEVDEDKWYDNEYEYNFLETIIVIIFVTMALIFETTWHNIAHRTVSSYRYGELEKSVEGTDDIRSESPAYVKSLHLPPSLVNRDGTLKHLRLPRELVSRSGGEFMTLGFLAFSIFTFNQLGGFELLAEQIPSRPASGWRYPKTAYQWLHTAEDVHMQLFVGMVFYFVLMSRVANGTVRKLEHWEKCKLRREALGRNLRLETIDFELGEHILWRRFFLWKMTRLSTRYPRVFQSLIDEMGLDPKTPDFPSILLANFEKAFSFSTYLAVNVERGVRDSIHVHKTTWGLGLVGLAVLALLHRFLQVTFVAILPVMVFCAVVCLGAMRIVIRLTLYRISRRVRAAQENEDLWPVPTQRQQLRRRRPMDIITMRLLQLILFLMANTFSRTVVDFQEWKSRPVNTGIFTALFSVLFIALAVDLPYSVPLFLAMMSMPPQVDSSKFKVFCAVQMQAMSEQRAKALVELELRLAARDDENGCPSLTTLLDEARTHGLREDELLIRLSLRGVTEPWLLTADPAMLGAVDSDGEVMRSRRPSRRHAPIDLEALANFDTMEMAGSGFGTPAPGSRRPSRRQGPICFEALANMDNLEISGSFGTPATGSRRPSRRQAPIDFEALAHFDNSDMAGTGFFTPPLGSRRPSHCQGSVDLEALANFDNLEMAGAGFGTLAPGCRRPSRRQVPIDLEALVNFENLEVPTSGFGTSAPGSRRPSRRQGPIDFDAFSNMDNLEVRSTSRPGSRRPSRRRGPIDLEALAHLDNLEMAAFGPGALPRSRRPSCRGVTINLEALANLDKSRTGSAGTGALSPPPRRSLRGGATDFEAHLDNSSVGSAGPTALSPRPRRSIRGGPIDLEALANLDKASIGGTGPTAFSPRPRRSIRGGPIDLEALANLDKSSVGGTGPTAFSPRPRRSIRGGPIDLEALANLDNSSVGGTGPTASPRPRRSIRGGPIDLAALANLDNSSIGGTGPTALSPQPRRSIRGGRIDLEALANLDNSSVGGAEPTALSPRPRRSIRGGPIDLAALANIDNSSVGGAGPSALSPRPRRSIRGGAINLEALANLDNSSIGGAGPGGLSPRPRRPSIRAVAIGVEAVRENCDSLEQVNDRWNYTEV